MVVSEKEWRKAFQGVYKGETVFDVPMKNFTSLGIGGPADILIIPEDPLSVKNVLLAIGKEGIPYFTLGGGTNILVRDGGVEGVVLALRTFNRIEVLKEGNAQAELFAEAGVPWQKLVNLCKERGYSGIEGLTGIPGTVGGAICGNAGSFGYETKDVLESVVTIDSRGRLERVGAKEMEFSYRSSGISEGDIVLSGNLRFRREERDVVAKRTEGFFSEKKKKQPISEKSAGCVFKNHGDVPAGRLIDEAGCKGMRIGGIEVSGVHANFFINRGGGTASDFLALMNEVSSLVHHRTGIVLEPEIKVIGRE